jgi:secondary thiamine-phosphate synthase enzyme
MLRQSLRMLAVDTSGGSFTDLTAAINQEIAGSGLALGTATLVCLHTSCSLTVNENADPRVLQDLTSYMRALVPQHGVSPLGGEGSWHPYRHNDEGPDDMPSHIRTALTSTSLTLSFQSGRLVLGTWQAIYLWEHRQAGQRRRLSLHLIGEPDG